MTEIWHLFEYVAEHILERFWIKILHIFFKFENGVAGATSRAICNTCQAGTYSSFLGMLQALLPTGISTAVSPSIFAELETNDTPSWLWHHQRPFWLPRFNSKCSQETLLQPCSYHLPAQDQVFVSFAKQEHIQVLLVCCNLIILSPPVSLSCSMS